MKKAKVLIELGVIIILSLIIVYKVSTDIAKEKLEVRDNLSYSAGIKP